MTDKALMENLEFRGEGRYTILSFKDTTELVFDSKCMLVHHMEKLKDIVLTEAIVFDLKNVTAMDSYGIGALVRLFKAISPENREVAIINADEKILTVIRQLGLHRIFHIFNNEADSRTYFSVTTRFATA